MTVRFRRRARGALLLATLLVPACSPSPVKDAPPRAAVVPPPADMSAAGDAAAASSPASSATNAAIDAGAGTPAVVAPLMIAELETGRAAIFLGDANGDEGDPREPLKVYVRAPIATVGRPIDETLLDADAKRALAKRYLVGGAKGATCDAALEAVAVVGRIPESDPTMGGHESEDDKTFARTVWGGDALGKKSGRARAHVALVRFAAPCKQPMFAVPDGAPYPTPLAVRALAKTKVASVRAALDKTWTTDSNGKARPFRAWTLGDGGPLWVRGGQTAADFTTSCGVVKDEASPSLVAQAPGCPEQIVGATRGPGDEIDVWFAHARARISGGAIEVTYFPTDYFGPSGGI